MNKFSRNAAKMMCGAERSGAEERKMRDGLGSVYVCVDQAKEESEREKKDSSFRLRYPIARFIVHFVAVIKLEYKLCECVFATNICMTYRILNSHFCHSLDR